MDPRTDDGHVEHYLVSFPSAAMDVGEDELPEVARTSRAVIAEAQEAGVYVFAGGIEEPVDPVLVHADGTTAPVTTGLDGGFCVLRVGSRAEALHWAARIAGGCRTPQELRRFQHDPMS